MIITCSLLLFIAFFNLWIIRQAFHARHFLAHFFRAALGIEAMGALLTSLFVYGYGLHIPWMNVMLFGHVGVQLTTIAFHKHRFHRL
jgi:hypothetical protein